MKTLNKKVLVSGLMSAALLSSVSAQASHVLPDTVLPNGNIVDQSVRYVGNNVEQLGGLLTDGLSAVVGTTLTVITTPVLYVGDKIETGVDSAIGAL